MRLPAYLLGLLAVGTLNATTLTGCGSEADATQEADEEQAALKSQSSDASVQDGGAVADSGKGGEPPIVSPDACPGCGLG